MYKPKLFLETTVFNFYFDGKLGQKRRDAITLFDLFDKGVYEVYTSTAVISELERASSKHSTEMLGLVAKYVGNNILSTTPEASRLARCYIDKGIIPKNKPDDALHIAVATVNNLDFVISSDSEHILKEKTMIGTSFVNRRAGYQHIGISSPTEVLEYDR
jgi:predicted nucleic acid-binding protein